MELNNLLAYTFMVILKKVRVTIFANSQVQLDSHTQTDKFYYVSSFSKSPSLNFTLYCIYYLRVNKITKCYAALNLR